MRTLRHRDVPFWDPATLVSLDKLTTTTLKKSGSRNIGVWLSSFPFLGHGHSSMKHLGPLPFDLPSWEESGYKRKVVPRFCSHRAPSRRENDHQHDCTAQPKWRKGLSWGIEYRAQDIYIIPGPGMGEMSHASKVCPLTALLTECIRRRVALMIRARSLPWSIYAAIEIVTIRLEASTRST